jgi:hypothetical protein
MEASLLILLILFQMSRNGNLLRFVVVVFIFAMQVTTPWHALYFISVRFYKGLMLKVDEK